VNESFAGKITYHRWGDSITSWCRYKFYRGNSVFDFVDVCELYGGSVGNGTLKESIDKSVYLCGVMRGTQIEGGMMGVLEPLS
jgi:hypothetical protein